ncbi:MAG: AAA family ATPase, partial [Prochlorococcus sp.]
AKDRFAAVFSAVVEDETGAVLRSLMPSPEPQEAIQGSDIEQLEDFAVEALSYPLEHRNPMIRKKAKRLGIPVSPRDVDRILRKARSNRDNRGAIRHKRGRTLDSTPTPWLWEDLLIGGAINVLGALPKVGKTSFLVRAIAAWHHGAGSFCGKNFAGKCPPVILIGTDQPQGDWSRMLQAADLYAGSDPDGITTPIRQIWTMEDGVCLDEEGLEVQEELAKDYPDAIFVVDSVAACVSSPLGIPEESPDIAEPLRSLQAKVGPYGGTTIFIAHAGKGRAGEDPICSLRGSTALPAVASQVLGLSRMTDVPDDRRILLQTQGRGGNPQKLLLSRDEQGNFACDGDAAEALLAQCLQVAEAKLTEEQSELLGLIRSRAEQGLATSLQDAVIHAHEDHKDRKAKDRARRRLQAIEKRGLITSKTESNGLGRIALWSPLGAMTRATSQSMSQASNASQLSNTKGCDGIEGFDGCTGVPHVPEVGQPQGQIPSKDQPSDHQSAVLIANQTLRSELGRNPEAKEILGFCRNQRDLNKGTSLEAIYQEVLLRALPGIKAVLEALS